MSNRVGLSQLLLIGASGAVGQAVLHMALADRRLERVIALTRRPLDLHHKKLDSRCIDFAALPTDNASWA